MESSSWRNRVWVVLVLGVGTAIGAPGQTLTTLVNFNETNGDAPEYGSLVQGSDGNFYGTTFNGGPAGLLGNGTIFKVTPAGVMTTLYDVVPLHGFDTSNPNSSMIQASDGNFYGTTSQGGLWNTGTIFRITPSGTFTTIHEFGEPTTPDVQSPNPGLIQGTDGNLWGTSLEGGVHGEGTVFKVTLSGTVTVVYSFSLTDVVYNGALSNFNVWGPEAGLVQAADGNFYGSAWWSSSIFKITPGGVLTLLHPIAQIEGYLPNAPLTIGADGNFYGTEPSGGASNTGTIFKMTPAGVLTVLHTFGKSVTDGNSPNYAPLVQTADGNFYGTTKLGGANNDGTIFKITPAGAFTLAYSFGVTDGLSPMGGLTLGKDGNLYGTTSQGGSGFHGTVFKLAIAGATPPPAAPAITGIVNDAGFKAGGPVASGGWVAVFGTNLAPAGDSRQWNPATEIVSGKLPTSLDGTSVTVNGKSAAVAYISPTQVNIQPPDDSAVGPVQVVVSTAAGAAGAPFTATYAQFAPGFFPASGSYLAVQHADGSYVGGYAGATAAKPGEVIVLWGSGFGPASPAVPAGQVFAGANKLASPATVTIGGQPAVVDFAGVVGAGLVQINVHVPASINNGDAAVVATVGGVSSQTTGNLISVHN